MKRVKKKAQIDLSFGFIFSAVLIIVFLGFAVYGIAKFIGMKNNMEVTKFQTSFQEDIDKLWKGNQGSQEVSYFLPNKIKEVCLINKDSIKQGTNASAYDELERYSKENDNLVFYPIGSASLTSSLQIQHINISKITEQQDPICFENKKGKTSFILEKAFGETLVNIKK
jgi:hypothetical protein